MAQQPADLIGRTLCRTYQVERLLGGGGMGAVYAARHVRTGGLFAVKILHRETASDADIYKRFQDEAKTVSALRHPHIVQVTDFDRDEDGTPFIVMELLEGEDLYQRLCRVNRLPVDQVLDIGRQVGSALFAAHEKGVIHRDIKPQNIFLVRHEVAEDVHETAKVVDFGISKIRRTGGQMTRDMTILGTPQFMSPEAALGQNSQLDGRADQWSLAVILYLALTGKLPFDGENLVGVLYQVVHEKPVPIRQLAPDAPEPLVAAVERAMSKKKDDRFPRMVDFVRALTGQGLAGAGSVRLGMASAVFRATPALQALSAPEAPTTPPQPLQQAGPQPSPGQMMAMAQAAADAPTATPHLMHAGQLPVTRPTMPAPTPELPVTVPLLATPQLPAVPTAQVSAMPEPAPRSEPGAGTGGGHTGNTPTNIALTDAEMQALLLGSEPTPAPAASQATSPIGDAPPLDSGAPSGPGDPVDPSEAELDPDDLQAVPTKVGVMPPAAIETLPLNERERRFSATVPLHVLRPPEQGNPFDSAYPSTLSRATGEEISLKPSLLPRIDWAKVGKGAKSLLGVTPRSPVRMAVAGGVAALLMVLVVFLVASSLSDTPPPDRDPSPAASPADAGTDGGPARDGSAAGPASSVEKPGAPGGPAAPGGKTKGPGGKAGTPAKRPGQKAELEPKRA